MPLKVSSSFEIFPLILQLSCVVYTALIAKENSREETNITIKPKSFLWVKKL